MVEMTEENLNEAVAKKCGDFTLQQSGAVVAAYATNLEIAWLLVERPGLTWQVFKYADGTHGAIVHDAAVAGEGQGKTAPEAICRAFLELPVKL